MSWLDDNGGILCTDQPASPDGIVLASPTPLRISLLAPGAFWKVVTKGEHGHRVRGNLGLHTRRGRSRGPPPPGAPGPDASRTRWSPARDGQADPGSAQRRRDAAHRYPRGRAARRLELPASPPAPATSIPDGTGSATATATISGFTRPIAAVQAWVEIDHPEPEQLRLTLTGPDGATALLQNLTGVSQHPINTIFGRGEFASRLAKTGTTLTVEDLVTGATGRIKFFAVTLIPLAEDRRLTKRSSARVPRTLNPDPEPVRGVRCSAFGGAEHRDRTKTEHPESS